MKFVNSILEETTDIIIELLARFCAKMGIELFTEYRRDKRDRDPYILFFGYIFWGVVLGVISLFFYPKYFVPEKHILAYCILAPTIIGGFFLCISFLLNVGNKRVITIGTFFYGFTFTIFFILCRIILIKQLPL